MQVRDELQKEVNILTRRIDMFHHIERFKEIIDPEGLPLYVGYADKTGKWIYVNNNFSNLLGYTKEEIYERPWIDFIIEEDRDEVNSDYVDKIKGSDRYINYPTTHLCKDGSRVIVNWNTSSLLSGDDQLTLCVAIM